MKLGFIIVILTRVIRSKKAGLVMKTVKHAFEILEYMIRSDGSQRLTVIADKCGINKTSTYNILQSLSEYGYIKKDDGSSKYALGDKLLNMPRYILEHSGLRRTALPSMEKLMLETGQTVNLMMLLGNEGYYAAIKKPEGVSSRSRFGESEHMYCSAVGKAILAFLPREKIEEILKDDPLIKRAERTITDRDAFLEELSLTRRRGFAIEDMENYKDSRCVAAPIFSDRHVIGSISVSGESDGVPISRFFEFSYLVQKAALEIEEKLRS